MKHTISQLSLICLVYFVKAQEVKLMLPIGHDYRVNSAAFSPDGKKVVTASRDYTAKVWDAATGNLLINLMGHTKEVLSAVFSPDGKKVVTNSYDWTAKIWDVETGILLATFKGEKSMFKSAIFSPDGKKVLTLSYNKTALIWDVATGHLLINLDGHKERIFSSVLSLDGSVSSAVFSPDGKKVVTALENNSAKIWDAVTGHLLADLKGHTDKVRSAVFSPDGKKLVTASIDHSAKIWDAATGQLLFNLKGDTDKVSSAIFSPDGKKVVTALEDKITKIWDAETGQLMSVLEGHTEMALSTVFSPDCTKLLTISSEIISKDGSEFLLLSPNKTAKIWDVATGHLLINLKGNNLNFKSAVFSPDGKKVLTALDDNKVLPTLDDYTAKIWDAATGQLLTDLKGHTYRVSSAVFSPDGTKLVMAASYDNTAKIWDVAKANLLINLKGHTSYVNKAVFSPDGKKVITTSLDKTAKIWDAETGNLLANLKGHNSYLYGAAFSPDGKKVMTTSNDSTAKIWDATTGHLLVNLSYVSSADFSPDGKEVMTISYESNARSWEEAINKRTAKIWDAETGHLLITLRGAKEKIHTAVFSPDGKKVVTVESHDFCAYIWDASSGHLLNFLRGYEEKINTAVFSPDGTRVLTKSDDGTAKIWDASTGNMLTKFNILKIPPDDFFSAVFSPNGLKVVMAKNNDSTVKIWDAAKGKLEKKIPLGVNTSLSDINFNNNRFIAIDNAEVKLFNLTTGEHLLSYFAIDSTDYINLIDRGYYKSSYNAAKLLHYVTKDSKIITFEQLDVKYNRPDKVLEAIGNSDTSLINSYRQAYNKRIKKLGIDTLQFRDGYSVPEADFINRDSIGNEQTKKYIKLNIHAVDSTSNLDRFNVWINQVPLFGQRGVSILPRNKKSFDTAITVILSQGENMIETSVYNVNGTESYRSPLFVKYTPLKEEAIKDRLHFIGIGTNEFANNQYNLNWCVKDIRDIAINLKEKYGGDIEIDTLFNSFVTTENVRALKGKLLKTEINDKVIIAYSGHGLLGKSYDYYLSTYKINFKKPEENGLPYDELESLLDSIPARKKLMLIDACNSGEVDKEEIQSYVAVQKKLTDTLVKGIILFEYENPKKLGTKNSFELMQSLFVNVGKNIGATIISAASGTQFALEKNNLKNGVFTYSLLEYMQNHESASVSELKKYVNSRVLELTSGKQQPTTRSETNQVDWRVW